VESKVLGHSIKIKTVVEKTLFAVKTVMPAATAAALLAPAYADIAVAGVGVIVDASLIFFVA
jgi:hypothetical protein